MLRQAAAALKGHLCTVWTIAGELWCTYRCSEKDDCILAELQEVRDQGAPLRKRLEN